MKKYFIYFLFVLYLLFSYTTPLHAQWIRANSPNGDGVLSLTASGTFFLAGAYSGGLYLSTDNGTSWNATGLMNSYIYGLAISGTNFFAGNSGGVLFSADNGTSWAQVNNGLTNTHIHALAVSGTYLFVGTSKGIFLSTNNGTSWNATGFPSSEVSTLAVAGTNIFAGTYGGVFLSTNNGTSWSQKATDLVTALAISGSNIFYGTYDGDVFLSKDNGTNWIKVDIGWTKDEVTALTVYDTYLFIGIKYNGVWKQPLSGIITSVDRLTNSLPTFFGLNQNYTNPFNPSTTIKYSIPQASFVKIKVFDALGREIATLVNEEKPAGTYTINFNAENLPSGVYFYKMRAGSFVQTKKLILLR